LPKGEKIGVSLRQSIVGSVSIKMIFDATDRGIPNANLFAK
jgi:hypothetical protein